MEKLDKKKVLAVVLIIALIAALVGTVSLLYNSIDMFVHNAVNSSNGPDKIYAKWQQPYAIILLFAFAVAALGTGTGIASFVAKKDTAKKACVIIALCVAVALLVLTVAAIGVNFDNEAHYYSDPRSLKYPYSVYGNQYYAVYAGTMAVLIPQLVYFVIIAAVLLIVSKIDKKAEKAATATVEVQTQETI